MSLKLFSYLLTILCVNPDSEYATSRCMDFMVNCVHIKSNSITQRDFDHCTKAYQDGERYQDAE